MVETLISRELFVFIASPCPDRGIEEIDRADHIGIDEGQRIGNRPIHMALSCQVDDTIRLFFFE